MLTGHIDTTTSPGLGTTGIAVLGPFGGPVGVTLAGSAYIADSEQDCSTVAGRNASFLISTSPMNIVMNEGESLYVAGIATDPVSGYLSWIVSST
jgi:hypothetical protein